MSPVSNTQSSLNIRSHLFAANNIFWGKRTSNDLISPLPKWEETIIIKLTAVRWRLVLHLHFNFIPPQNSSKPPSLSIPLHPCLSYWIRFSFSVALYTFFPTFFLICVSVSLSLPFTLHPTHSSSITSLPNTINLSFSWRQTHIVFTLSLFPFIFLVSFQFHGNVLSLSKNNYCFSSTTNLKYVFFPKIAKEEKQFGRLISFNLGKRWSKNRQKRLDNFCLGIFGLSPPQ